MNRHVLGMNMPDCALERAHCRAWVDALPEQVRWIEVRAESTPSSVAQAKQRFRIVHQKTRMHLERDFFDSVLARKLDRFLPIRNRHLSPLVFQNLQEIRRPRARHPIRLFVAWRATRTAAEG